MKAKKSLGQNFLRDEKVVERIIESVKPAEGEVILEVGPGEGVLTERLAKSGATVIAVELDDRLIPVLKKKFAQYSNVHIVHADILRIDISALLACYILHATHYRVVGNLPYYITQAIIRMFLELLNPPKEMFFMVQKEVAERICAGKGEMSVLSVAVQYYAKPEILFDVPKEVFEPVPKVESSFVRVARKMQNGELRMRNEEKRNDFFRVVKIGFSARRKTLANNLANGLQMDRKEIEAILESLNLKKTTRAQELSVEEWKELTKALL